MLDKIKTLICGTYNLDKLKKDGQVVGSIFRAMEMCIIARGIYVKINSFDTNLI